MFRNVLGHNNHIVGGWIIRRQVPRVGLGIDGITVSGPENLVPVAINHSISEAPASLGHTHGRAPFSCSNVVRLHHLVNVEMVHYRTFLVENNTTEGAENVQTWAS